MSIDPSATIADLVLEHPSRARVFEELHLDYCCGGRRSLKEACEERGLGLDDAVRALDTASTIPTPEPDWTAVSLAELSEHIVSVHHRRLRQELPRLDALLEKVVRAHGDEDPSLAELRATFVDLRTELESHMADEEENLFPLFHDAGPVPRAALFRLEDDHADAGAALVRMRGLAHDYDLTQSRCNTHRATLDGLRELELELHEHIHEENNVLFPRALATE